MEEDRVKSEICGFYKGKNVFMTGVSGFLGKAILEKLLRSCPEIGSINVLMRPKKGLDVNSRLQSLIQTPIFDRLRQENPEGFSKIRIIPGDIVLPDLGMTAEDRDHLIGSVSVVIHSAASVKFNEPLKQAMNINYYGTQKILDLCHQVKHLAAFVHISTAYSNCDLDHITEKIVRPDIIPNDEINSLSDDVAEQITPMLLGNKPNTYTYTKCLGENLILDQRGHLPTAIVRPSIIGATWKTPEPGYVDSICGLTGVIAASSKGLLICLNCDGNNVCDVIPLDVVANIIIAAGWDIAVNRQMDIPVYNICTGSKNPLVYSDVKKYGTPAVLEAPMENVLRYPTLNLTKSTLYFFIINTLFTFIPCVVMDFLALLTGRKPSMIKIYHKMLAAMAANNYFHSRQFRFDTRNMDKLRARMGSVDQQLFYWNIEDLDWNSYIRNYCRGIKRWIFKEDFKNIPQAKAHLRRMFWLQKVAEAVFLFVLWSFVIKPILGIAL